MIDYRVKEQLALEFNCSLEDFDRDENIITKSCLHDKRRKFSDTPFSFRWQHLAGMRLFQLMRNYIPGLMNG